jgi:hypothetical protein
MQRQTTRRDYVAIEDMPTSVIRFRSEMPTSVIRVNPAEAPTSVIRIPDRAPEPEDTVRAIPGHTEVMAQIASLRMEPKDEKAPLWARVCLWVGGSLCWGTVLFMAYVVANR